MDRLTALADDLARVLAELRAEAACRELFQLAAPLAWLEESNGWLRYELARLDWPASRDPVPFTFIPAELRR